MTKISAKKIALKKLGELKLEKPLQKGRPAYISSASGLVRHKKFAYVVADDELHLGIFAAEGLQPDEPLRLLPGKLARDIDKRKKEKPDFEVLAELPATANVPHGALLILGSGSRANRDIGLLMALTDTGKLHRDRSLQLDLSALYTALQREFSGVNIEGAVVQNEHLLLLQRGNKGLQTNAIVRLDLSILMHEIELGTVSESSLRDVRSYVLGELSDVPLCFSDATCLPDGRLLALAVAEDTDDAYVDGAVVGSALCQFDRNNQLQTITPLDLPVKAEGIAVWSLADKTLGFVTDADNPDIPAALYLAEFDALI
jgi:hypothetical protein